MKICSYCGNQLSDDMQYCPRCGAKYESSKAENPLLLFADELAKTNNLSSKTASCAKPRHAKSAKKMRTGMKVGMIICFVFATIYALTSIALPVTLSATVFFCVLGVMFWLLGFSPKESKYLFGNSGGLRKNAFVFLCIAISFAAFLIAVTLTVSITSSPSDNAKPPKTPELSAAPESNSTLDGKEDSPSLSDIQGWYNKQMPAVSQDLMEYAKSVKGLSWLNVDESKFRFGEDSGWYDCHYTFYFRCEVNGVIHSGEARGFVEYQSTDINWFHFEIFANEGIHSLVEHYDASYDKIIEDYYKELVNTYGNG